MRRDEGVEVRNTMGWVALLTLALTIFAWPLAAQVKLGGAQVLTKLQIVTTSLPEGTVGEAYSATLKARGGTLPYKWSLVGGSLPDGLSLAQNGIISGTPTTAGTSNFKVMVTDARGQKAEKTLAIVVADPLVITTTLLPDGTLGALYSFQLEASGGTLPYTWNATGLPTALSMSADGVLSGTPELVGFFSFSVEVIDSFNRSDSKLFSMDIATPVEITTLVLPDGEYGVSYSFQFDANGGVPPYTWMIESGALPTGLTLDASGLIQGTPTTYGIHSITVRVMDTSERTDYASFSFDIIDTIPPVIFLVDPTGGEVWGGVHKVKWNTQEANKNIVEIRLSSDSGVTFPTLIEAAAPDTFAGYNWNMASLPNGSTYRIQVMAIDDYGNTSVPKQSPNDFTIDNTPPIVSGFARYSDINNNGICDAGDTVIVPFDRNVSVKTGASDEDFSLPVMGDSLGVGASVSIGSNPNEAKVTLGVSPHLKSRHVFDLAELDHNAASGIDISSNIAPDTIVSSQTGAFAAPSVPIDIIPGFVKSTQVLHNNNSTALELCDLDGDGDLDVIECHSYSATHNGEDYIWFNDGNGGFVDSGQVLGLYYNTVHIGTGDFDADGDIDFVATYNGWPNRVWFNDGAGYFTESVQDFGFGRDGVVVGDFDCNGSLDFIIRDHTILRKWFNDGSGTFSEVEIWNIPYMGDMVAGDVDNDGDLDIVATSGEVPAGNSILMANDGAGSFAFSFISVWTSYSSVIGLGDIDLDGDLDLATGSSGSSPSYINVWQNDGNANYSDTGQNLPHSGAGLNDILMHDMDGDGDLDIAVASSENKLWLNDGNGLFESSGLYFGDMYARDVVVGDVNSDGDDDVIFACGKDMSYPYSSYQGTQIWFNSLSGTWGSVTFVDSGQQIPTNPHWQHNHEYVEFEDVDRDGDLDLLNGTSVWLNDGLGNFSDSGQTVNTGTAAALVTGDIDGDGDIDFIHCAKESSISTVWLNNGIGLYSQYGQLSTADTTALVFADVNSDGDLDLIEGRFARGNRVWFNNGSGAFTNSNQDLKTAASDRTMSIAAGDVDRDGDIDFVEGNSTASGYTTYSRVWFNNGNGYFSPSSQGLSPNEVCATANLADFDLDGDLDLIVGGGYTVQVRVLLNDGVGFFVEVQRFGEVQAQTVEIELGDVDGDGDFDAVVGNDNGYFNEVWLNDGSGIFQDSGMALGINPYWLGSVDIGDIDSDGDIDIVFGNHSGSPTTLWLNE